ncbi:iron ABC transporter permease [Candidatus Bathyarchaeota archaeon A05DMB-2]|jgi:iron complex transport system permease protein|nr:iron ABC transporter permease [Candidatus Bathyarchaeota archaeon A05DMB-2]
MVKSLTINSTKEDAPDYLKYIGKKVLFITVCAVALLLVALFALSLGSANLSVAEVISQILSQSGIAWSIRLPRVLVAVVAGAMLAVAGAVMQCILKNHLSEPYTLGLSQAAAFGAAFAIVFLGAGSTFSNAKDAVIVSNQYTVALCAFCFSLISTAVILVLTRLTRVSPEAIVLSGVVMGSVFGAALTAVQYFASDVQIASIVYWTFGDLSRITWDNLALIGTASLPVLIYFIYNRWNYNALDAGIDTASSLGVNVNRHVIVGMVLSSLIAALIVSMMGVIGFVGLLAPHMVRRVIGSDNRFVLPASALVGALILVVSDTIARTIIAPLILPVGVITSFMGGPLFLYILIRGYRKRN